MITMTGISRFFAETLNENAEFIALSNSLLGEAFTYYINVDVNTVETEDSFFGIVTFNDKDDKEVEKKFQSMFLINIQRDDTVEDSGIVEEATLDKLEQLTRKALEVIAYDIRAFGIQGEKNVKVSYINMYVPAPDGEDNLQMQVDIDIEQDKYLSCN